MHYLCATMSGRFFLYTVILLVSLSGAFLASCDRDEPVTPGPEPEPEPVYDASRTVLVYQVATKNGLDRLSLADLAEMKQAVADGQLGENGRLLVYNHYGSEMPVLLDVTPDGTDTLKIYDLSLLSVQADRMLEVFDDMETFASAPDYGLILWGHGTGWLQDGIADRVPEIAPLSYGGQNASQWMNIDVLAQTVEAGPDFSFVYFDCCHMASVEVAYEMRNATPYIIGCVSELPGEGMPYHLNVANFFAEGAPDVIGAAATTFNYYDEWLAAGRRPECSPSTFSSRYAAMSVIATEGLGRLAEITADIYASTPGSYPEGFEPQRFGRRVTGLYDYYFDFGQYVEALCVGADGAERFSGAASKLAAFREALGDCVPYAATMPYLFGGTTVMNYHCGLSTYILQSTSDVATNNYGTLSWYDDVASRLKLN